MRPLNRGSWFKGWWEKKLYPEPIDAYVTGSGFNTELSSNVEEGERTEVIGRGFSTELLAYSGGSVIGGGFSTEFSATALANNEAFVTGGTFSTNPVINVQGIIDLSVTGGGFASDLIAYDAARINGNGFNSELSANVDTSELITLTGRGFTQSIIISAVGNESVNITGRGFYSELLYSNVVGRSFNTTPVISVTNEVTQDEAFVMNVHTNEVTRYTNYQFSHIIHIGGKPYGVRSDGLYLLEGLDDNGASINATIETKETDFGSYRSKNITYVYLNSDSTTNLTSFVDGIEKVTYAAEFNGRKTKLGRGAKGRYWRFKIENIERIEGIEVLPQEIQRRVK